jgi:hypothetical protein
MAWGGAVGPMAFIGAWALGGMVTSRTYSPVEDTISRLAATSVADRRRAQSLAAFGLAMAVVSAVALPTSLVVSQSGLFQRIGLTAGDLFLIASVPAVSKLLQCRSAT